MGFFRATWKGEKLKFTSEKICIYIENHKTRVELQESKFVFCCLMHLHLCQKGWSICFSHEVSRFQSFLSFWNIHYLPENSLSIKGGKKKKGKRKIWGKFYLNIPSSFPSFPEVFHSQAFQCNCRSVWADHFEDNGKSWSLLNSICCFCNTDFFICFDQINWGFWPSLSSLLKGHWHNCLPYQRLCWLSTQVPINPPRAVTSIPHHPPYYFLFQN